MNQNAAPTIRDLYPQFSEPELAEAEENFDRYVTLVLRIFERLESEADPQAGQLTGGAGTVGSYSPQASA